MKLEEALSALDERTTGYHLTERVDRKQLDKYPVLKLMMEMKRRGEPIPKEAANYMRKIQLVG